MRNVLIIGSGGREHSIALKLAESRQVKKMFAIPGNFGISKLAECCNIDIMNNSALVDFAKEKQVDLVVVGPEVPLANGVIDEFEKNGISAFGPNKKAAQFEASKSFTRKFIKKHGLPGIDFEEFTSFENAKNYIEKKGAPIVVKADGLAAGKGVFVARTEEEAITFARECLEENKFGKSSSKIIIEDFLEGEEVSYLVFTDSKTYKPMVYSQDHKQIYEGDKGPNTGGMGAYSPARLLEGFEDFLDKEIMSKFLAGIKEEGIEYKGVLYVGLMITKDGPKILEFNCRFGDPETQVILPRLENDLVEVMDAVIHQDLNSVKLEWKKEYCVCVVLSSKGYPNSYEKGKVINGLDDVKDVQVIHAGTKEENGRVLTNGGRVLNIIGLGKTLKEALDKTYSQIEDISFEGMYYRHDIAAKGLGK
ncbi:MAG: phosphoribosylamine--glycine ligase [Nanoarchaeota archaeon]|nr:phosphoribosylamine--glycine ligase [Nanoarchaeota archaeon]MBU1269988.1 phosphoribosylamine--glycine ligase [Nanoarchaeota archaeon]MBU1604410.1 phosphoribosylamine--glycine ligase [Nanoarchaeota archaeon]MBU2442586.1 phosphoribosylamine--glycine ligase [Nanoarchaeota archaeon]